MIDLHSHSICSDGELSPIELLKLAEENKLEIFSITDHNTVLAYKYLEHINVKTYFSGELINGCEINCSFDGVRIEALVYNFDINILDTFLKKYYSNDIYQKNNIREFQELYNKCLVNNLRIDSNSKYDPKKEFPMNFIYNELTKYKENEKIMGSEEFNSRALFYRKCTSSKSYVLFCDFMDSIPSLEEVSKIVRSCGGKIFLAHPFGYQLDNYYDTFNKLVNSKLFDGFECFHPNFDERQTDFLINYCKVNKLFMSAGSDFHRFGDRLFIGRGKNNFNVDKDVINNWL